MLKKNTETLSVPYLYSTLKQNWKVLNLSVKILNTTFHKGLLSVLKSLQT
jgi:hypothetical protein